MSKQRDKAETLAAEKHWGAWDRRGSHGDGLTDRALKAHQKEAKRHKRARRRLDKYIIEDELH